MKRILISIALCATTIGAGVILVYYFAVLPARAAAAQPPATKPAAPGTNVHVQVLEPKPFDDLLHLTGQALAWERIEVASEGAGNILKQNIEIGAAVSKGDILFEIDTIAIQADNAQAKARHILAQEELKRVEALTKSGVASPQALDQARSEERVALAALRATETRFNRSIVPAPLDGVVSDLLKERGEYVDFGTPMVELVQIDRLNAVIPVPERDIPRFNLGDSVEIQFDAFPGETFTGTIFRIQPSADLTTRTYPVEVELPNPDGRLRPGMTARAAMVRERHPDAIVIPLFAIRPMENQYFVVLEQDGFAHLRQVVPGKISGDQVHILSGLSAGERLIVSGHRDLREGVPVVVHDKPNG